MQGSKKDIAKLKNAIRSEIRRSFSRSEHYKEFLKLHRIEWKNGNRKRVSYKCKACTKLFSSKDIQVDHIVPIGNGVYEGIEDAKRFAELVYCSYDNLQILCKECHKVKSKEEQSEKSYHNVIF